MSFGFRSATRSIRRERSLSKIFPPTVNVKTTFVSSNEHRGFLYLCARRSVPKRRKLFLLKFWLEWIRSFDHRRLTRSLAHHILEIWKVRYLQFSKGTEPIISLLSRSILSGGSRSFRGSRLKFVARPSAKHFNALPAPLLLILLLLPPSSLFFSSYHADFEVINFIALLALHWFLPRDLYNRPWKTSGFNFAASDPTVSFKTNWYEITPRKNSTQLDEVHR